MAYVDAILHIQSLPDLISHLTIHAPERLSPAGEIIGFDATPMTRKGDAALTYVRLSQAEAERWRGTPGVTVLAEAGYGAGTADILYARLFADPTAAALYAEVYSPAAAADDVAQAGGGVEAAEQVIWLERFGILL